ncbi:hypothetical protein WJX84_010666 [Apatococcus fuscideae]|uniref:Glutathione S-transferase n=1 Tax=Apatococcus fuscideae TaxID=2026836 RepID=A0AAW1TFB9_9CHLO
MQLAATSCLSSSTAESYLSFHSAGELCKARLRRDSVLSTRLRSAHLVLDGSRLKGPPPCEPGQLTFYTHTLCPYAERVWLTLLEKGAPFQLVQVDLSDKPRWYRSVNSSGLVPAIEHKGTFHTESMGICRWIDASLEGPALMPADDVGQQQAEALLRAKDSIVSSGLSLASGSDSRSWGIGSRPTGAQRKAFESSLQALSTSLEQHGGPFLLGPQLTLADLVLLPFMERFDLVTREFLGMRLETMHGGRVQAWLEGLRQRPSCRTASADRRLLLEAYREHRSLDFFDYQTYSAAACHPQLAYL